MYQLQNVKCLHLTYVFMKQVSSLFWILITCGKRIKTIITSLIYQCLIIDDGLQQPIFVVLVMTNSFICLLFVRRFYFGFVNKRILSYVLFRQIATKLYSIIFNTNKLSKCKMTTINDQDNLGRDSSRVRGHFRSIDDISFHDNLIFRHRRFFVKRRQFT